MIGTKSSRDLLPLLLKSMTKLLLTLTGTGAGPRAITDTRSISMSAVQGRLVPGKDEAH